MTLRLLDLDSSQTWHSRIESFVYGTEVWPEIEAKLDGGNTQCAEFLSQVRCAEDYLRNELAKYLRHVGREILFSEYTYVAGYHGCRPKDLSSYQNREFFLAIRKCSYPKLGPSLEILEDSMRQSKVLKGNI